MRCPLCGSINSNEVRECITCSWHGEFWTSPEVVEEGLEELLAGSPELLEAMLRRRPKKISFKSAALEWMLHPISNLRELANSAARWLLQAH
jgi:hypothetical protein